MILDRKILFLCVSILIVLPIVFSQKADIEVSYSIGKGNIQISVKGEHSGSAEFYEGNYTAGDANYVDPIERSKGSALLKCSKNGLCNSISFDSVDIYKPGDYYFAVRDKNQIAERRNFYVRLEDLLSCDYNGTIIRNNECVSKSTNNVNDKPLFCSNQKIVPRCAGPGFCGCSSSEQICCTNENFDECRGRLGECVLPGNGRVLEKEIKEREVVVGQEIVGGCLVNNVKVPQGICLNNVLDLNLSSSDNLFAQQCSCVDRSAEADLDKDGFDSVAFTGGRDCNDANPNIHPLVAESCSVDTGFDNVDNNCDGTVDLDCNSFCDKDGDGYTSNFLCSIIGKKSGECDDNRADRYPGFPGIEVCGDQIDNNCDNVVDNNDICVCKSGDTRPIGNVRRDGIEECVDGKTWRVVKSANENPLIFVKTARGTVESGIIEVGAGEQFEIEVKFSCPEGDCDVEVE